MNTHPSVSMPVELMDTSRMNQPIPASQTMYQQPGDGAYQELPAPANNNNVYNLSEAERFGHSLHPTSEIKSDIFPTATIGSDVYPTAVGSDEYPMPVSSPALTSSLQYTGAPGMTHDPENPAAGHAGVVQKPPKKMVNCCGSMYRHFAFKSRI